MENTLNKMQLNGTLLVGLFPHSLYQISDAEPSDKALPADTSFVKFLGGNAAGILVLVSDRKNTFLGEEEMNLLIKMLEACKLNTGDVAIVNLATDQHSVDSIINEMRPEKIIAFGIDDTVTSPLYQVSSLAGIPIVSANNLSEMLPATEASKVAKQKLWASLKSLFGMN
jgi:hypothetical protein